ncbi:MAG: PAS domain-containing protein [Desulfovibrionaceae bacterium]|jgi:PAS domain-containing protein|nr:PAS domain-containing protein [Desulfovibrionaceae bacterium]
MKKKIFKTQSRGTAFVLCCFFLVVGVGAWHTAGMLRDQRVEALTEEVRQYQADVLASQSEMISTQLVEWVVRARELAKARIFRGAIANFASMKADRKDRAQEDFENFVASAGFLAGHLFGVNGNLLATTMGKLDATENSYFESIRSVVQTRVPFFSPLYAYKGGLVSDLYIPVYPTGALSDSASPDHVLVVVIPLQNVLRAFLGSARGLRFSTTVHLVQQGADDMGSPVFEEIAPAYPDSLKLEPVEVSLADVEEVRFGPRTDLKGADEVYSTATSLPAVRWWLAAETGRARLAGELRGYELVSLALLVAGGLVALLFTSTAALFASRLRYRRIARGLKEEVEPLRRGYALLGAVAEALPVPVCLRHAESGRVEYVNRAFGTLCGKSPTVALGLTVAELFNPDEAAALAHGDQMLAMSDAAYTQEIAVYRGARPILFEAWASRVALGEQAEHTLLVFRDVTEERAQNSLNIEMRQQIIDALVRAVESVPFLDGHTALLRKLAMEVAETLLLSDEDCSTVEAAAILSQVGKTFVPKEIMEKQGKLTPEEIREMQRYVEHTCRLLEGIRFHLPITETIWQLQENLDGTGYPNGLRGDDIFMPARILGATNTFSALVQKRSYRKAKTAREAVQILWQMADTKYDHTVIQALEAVVDSPRGQRMLRASNIEYE